MATVSRGRFRAALAALDTGSFAAFVVDLHRTRGHDATRPDDRTVGIDGCRVHVHVPGVTGWASVPSGVDAVVTPGTGRPRGVPSDVAVIDADALYERTVHGVDRDDRERLLGTVFDRPVTGDAVDRGVGDGGATTAAGTGTGTGTAGRSGWRVLHAVLAVVALGLVAAAVVGLPVGSDGPATQRAAGGDAGAGSAVGTATPFVGDGPRNGTGERTDDGSAAGTQTPRPPPADAYPPGVNASGITDPTALLSAHARGLSDRDYRAVLTYAEYDDVGRIGRRKFVATVRKPDLARTSVTARGAGFGVADPVPETELFATGDTVYYRERVTNGTRYRIERDGFPLAQVAVFGQSFLVRALDVDASELAGSVVRDGDRLFRIRIRGDGHPRTREVSGTLLVDSDGVVRRVRHSYSANGSDELTAEVTLRYGFEDVVVDAPAWIDEARILLANSSGSAAYAASANASTDASVASGPG